TFTLGKTAASRRRGRRPARTSRQAAVLPPGPPPITITSCSATSASPEGQKDSHPIGEREAHLLDRVRDAHRRKQGALDVDGALHIGFGEGERSRVAHEPDEGVRP